MKKTIIIIALFCVLLNVSAGISEAAINRIFIVFDGTYSFKEYIHNSILNAQQFLSNRKLRKQKKDEVMVVVAKSDIIPVFDGTLEKNILLMNYLENVKMFENKNQVINFNNILQQAQIFYGRPTNEDVNNIFLLFSDCLSTGMPGSYNSVVAEIEAEKINAIDNGYILYVDAKAEKEYINLFRKEGLKNITLKSPTAMISGYTIPVPVHQEKSQEGIGRLFKVFILFIAFSFIVITLWAIIQKRGLSRRTNGTNTTLYEERP